MKTIILLLCAFSFHLSNANAASIEMSLQDWVEHSLSQEQQQKVMASLPEYESMKTEVMISTDPDSRESTVIGNPKKHSYEQMYLIGLQVGFYMPLTVEALAQFRRDQKAFLDGSLKVAPSFYRQELIAALDYHLFSNHYYVGVHGSQNYLRAPWSQDYDSRFDKTLGAGVQLGTRGLLGKKQRLMGSMEVGTTWTLSKEYDTPMMFHFRVGLAWRI